MSAITPKAFAAWMAAAEADAPRTAEFYKGLVAALEHDDVLHWTHLLDVEVASLKNLDTGGKARLPRVPRRGPDCISFGRSGASKH